LKLSEAQYNQRQLQLQVHELHCHLREADSKYTKARVNNISIPASLEMHKETDWLRALLLFAFMAVVTYISI
jgi:hypothetical protein